MSKSTTSFFTQLLPWIVLFFLSTSSTGYSQSAMEAIVDSIRDYIVSIEAYDDTVMFDKNGDTIRFHTFGSGVLYVPDTTSMDFFALTNEHVVAIKDSLNRTIKIANHIVVRINYTDIGAISCEAKIRYIDEDLDLAALLTICPSAISDKKTAKAFGPNYMIDGKDLKEGMQIIYAGFPLAMGLGHENKPLFRTGIISQVVKNSKTFLIDAFVQPGYSGSPVFAITQTGLNEYRYYFAGLAQAYPQMEAELMYKMVGGNNMKYFVYQNPGFTIVIGVEEIRQLFRGDIIYR